MPRLHRLRLRLPGFAPALGGAVLEALRTGMTQEDIETLTVAGAASLRGIERLTGLETLILEHPASVRPLRRFGNRP